MSEFTPNNFEIYTSVDKAKRDQLFAELRKNGDAYERQAVKFSGVQPVLGEDGLQLVDWVQYHAQVKGGQTAYGNLQMRPRWQSNWSVAHPIDPLNK